MALMQRLRDKTHIILWTLLILFLASMTVGGLVGGADILDIFSQKGRLKDAAGMVNGKKLEAAQYSRMIQDQLEQYRQNNQEVSDMEMDRISEDVWQSFITETLMAKEIKKLGLKISDNEIYQTLVNYPPQFLIQHEAFQTNGQFDYQKYLNALNNPQGDEWQPVEEYVRSMLPYEKIRYLFDNLPMVSESEIENEYINNKVTFDFQTLVIPFSLVLKDSIPVTNDEIKKYYNENKKRFLVPESRELEYVKFDLRPTKADTQAVYQQILSLRDRIRNGESFETIATEFTEDPSGSRNGGDLGWFGKGQMVEAFEKAAFALRKGQLSNPVLTQYGYHLIKVEDRRVQNGQIQIKARHILLKIKPTPDTIETLRSQANLFVIDANDIGFEAAADSHRLVIQKTSPFAENERTIPGLGYLPSANRLAFSDKPVGTISELISTDNAFYIFRLSKITPEFYRPLSEVDRQLYNIILNEKRTDKLKEIAAAIYDQIKQSGKLETVLQKYPELQLENYSNHSLNVPLRGFSYSNAVVGTILGLKPEQISQPIQISTRFVIIKLIQRTPLNSEDYKVEKEAIRQRLLMKKKNMAYANWLSELKQNAKIIDNRANFY